MNFMKSPAFWILMVAIFTTPHISGQVATYLAVGGLVMTVITALLIGSKQ